MTRCPRWSLRQPPIFRGRRAAVLSAATAITLVAMEATDVTTSGAAGDRVHDERTAPLFAMTMAVATTTSAASLLHRSRLPMPRNRASFWTGIAITWGGVALNRWARRTLAQNYRSLVTIVEHHEVIDGGPYGVVRHPMYLGSMMICAGVGTALATWPSRIAWALPPMALVRRIDAEERVLTDALGDRYDSYAAARPRLIPGLW